MKTKTIIGNWKMNTSILEGESLLNQIAVKTRIFSNVKIGIALPYTHIHTLQNNLKGSAIVLGGQNCASKKEGAYTGEISARMLASVLASFVLVGHSECRAYFNETSDVLLDKIHCALDENLEVIYCCGESIEQRKKGHYTEILQKQLEETVLQLSPVSFKKISIAYEPIWAIGTGKTATPSQAQEVHCFIRKQIAQVFGIQMAAATSILYGGSCKPDNAQALLSQQDIDGGLIGGASLEATDFSSIVEIAQNIL